jgi:cation:H+ antiporter
MTGLAVLALLFLLCAALIARAGYVLSESADRIARATGLTGGWMGLALLATVTSLPELASGISAVTWVDAPNLAVGNVLGACVFNLLFLAVVEMAVTLSALRLSALDMAIGNLLGSNLFNLTILAVDDALYTRGPLLADAAPVHIGSAAAAIVMTGLVMVGLLMRPQGRVLRVLSWISVGLVAAYGLNAAFVFLHGT